MSRQASSVTPCWKLPPFPRKPKTSNGSPSPSDGDGHVQVAELGLELGQSCWAGCGAWPVS